ncbi:MAG: hypothetical protein ABEJ65_12480 [bacterium]
MLVLVLLPILFIAVSGCGTESRSGHADHSHSHGNGHGHSGVKKPNHISDTPPGVTLKIEKENDAYVGRLTFENYKLIHAGEDPSNRPGVYSGHAHLYVDGKLNTMIYNESFTLPVMKPGDHHIVVTLSDPNHKQFMVDGSVIKDTATVIVSEK